MGDPRLGERSGKFERRQLQGNALSYTISPLVQQSPCSRDGVMSCRYFGGCGGEATIRSPGPGVVNFLTALSTPSFLPLLSSEVTL